MGFLTAKTAANTAPDKPSGGMAKSSCANGNAAALNPEAGTATTQLHHFAQHLVSLWPIVAGLALGRVGLVVTAYGSYARTDEGLFTDGATLISLAILLVALIAIIASNAILTKRLVNAMARICIAIETATLFALACIELTMVNAFEVRFLFCTICTLASYGAMCYWLRRSRGASASTAAIIAFSALALSEIVLCLCFTMPPYAAKVTACALTLLQYPCMIWAHRRSNPCDVEYTRPSEEHVSSPKELIESKQFLITMAIGIGLLSIVIGFLRGYPTGEPIPLSPAMRMTYAALTIAICLGSIAMVLDKPHNAMTIVMLFSMEAMACLTLILYAAFPEMLEIGAMLATTLNAVMVGFIWYIIVMFMGSGVKDPYYYAISGWLVWPGCRALARVSLIAFPPLSANNMLMASILGALVMLSTQVLSMQLLTISKLSGQEAMQRNQELLAKVTGIDEGKHAHDVRQAVIEHSAESIGRQFLLSQREVEVLALYAQGFTQKRVASQLFISQGTVHAHIKHIYSKTGFHSRQEILDYMKTYT